MARVHCNALDFSKEMWPEIEKCEKYDEEGNMTFEKLRTIPELWPAS